MKSKRLTQTIARIARRRVFLTISPVKSKSEVPAFMNWKNS